MVYDADQRVPCDCPAQSLGIGLLLTLLDLLRLRVPAALRRTGLLLLLGVLLAMLTLLDRDLDWETGDRMLEGVRE